MKTFIHYSFSLACFLLLIQLSYSQSFTLNDSFEGNPIKHVPPPDWHNCNDNVSTVDTQPCGGIGSSVIPGTDGNSYISIVTRQMNPPGTVETVWADLLTPMIKDHCYDIRLDYCISSELYGTLDWTDYYFNNPARLQILGLNGDCTAQPRVEVLYTSEVISGYSWETHDIRLHPRDTSYSRVAFRACFIEPGTYYNSAILLDNLRYTPVETDFIREQGVLKLPDDAREINWYFNNVLVEDADSTLMPFFRKGLYRADYLGTDSCRITVESQFELDGAGIVELYPNPTPDILHLKCMLNNEIFFSIRMYDMSGRLLRVTEHLLPEGLSIIDDDIRDFPPGIYYLKCTAGREIYEFKIVKT